MSDTEDDLGPDRATLALYDEKAADYADRFRKLEATPRLSAFIAQLPPGARVLDLGCGPGTAAAAMQAAGLEVDALDASAGMIALARERFGLDARLGTFDEVEPDATYDGIWANFSLLHAPRAAMPGHLARLYQALAPGGLFHIGLKLGEGEERDSLGRFYTYYTEAELLALLIGTGFTPISQDTGRDEGFAGTQSDWIVVWSRKE